MPGTTPRLLTDNTGVVPFSTLLNIKEEEDIYVYTGSQSTKEGRPVTIGLVNHALSCIVFHLNDIEIDESCLYIPPVNSEGI